MPWKPFQLRLRLAQPMAVGPGWRLGFVMLTRLYVPPRTLWGAFTDALARWHMAAEESDRFMTISGNNDLAWFKKVGDWIGRNVRFLPGLFCIRENSREGRIIERLLPWYRFGKGLGVNLWTQSGDWLAQSQEEAQRRYVAGHGATALNYETASAEEGMLYETERIMPRIVLENGAVGKVWLELMIFIDEVQIASFTNWIRMHALDFLRIGRDVSVGDGVFDDLTLVPVKDIAQVNGAFRLTDQQPEWYLENNQGPEIRLFSSGESGNGGGFIRPPGPCLIKADSGTCKGYWGQLRHHIVREHSVGQAGSQGFGQKIGYADDHAQWVLEFGSALATAPGGGMTLALEKEGFTVVPEDRKTA